MCSGIPPANETSPWLTGSLEMECKTKTVFIKLDSTVVLGVLRSPNCALYMASRHVITVGEREILMPYTIGMHVRLHCSNTVIM